MSDYPTAPATGDGNDSLNIRDLFELCLSHWKWFALSLAVCLGLAVTYILCTHPGYTRTATVLVKKDTKGRSTSSDLSDFSGLGLFQSRTNVYNEVVSFSSPALISEVVKRMHLDMRYYAPGTFHDIVAYGANLPISVELPDVPENESAGFTLEIQADAGIVLSEITHKGKKTAVDTCRGKLGEPFSSPVGTVLVTSNDHYIPGEAYTFYISKANFYGTVDACSARLNVALRDKESTAIDLTYRDNSKQRAEDFLNTLITVYNESWVADKNKVAVSTSKFISERLAVIERELGTVDSDISNYKSENLIPDVQAASNLYMTQSIQANLEQTKVQNRLYMTRYVRDYLVDEANRYQLLPANSGIESTSIESQIAEYNRQLLQRNTLLASSSESNPIVKDMNAALEAMRSAIITSIDNQIVTLNKQLNSLQRTERQATSRIQSNPTQAQYLLSVERQQKVKESLYIYLLQKREENELSQTFTADNIRVITPPYGKQTPTSPVKRNILLLAFALGLCIPVGILYLRSALNTRIRGKKDLERVSAPFIGEIPQLEPEKKFARWRLRFRRNADKNSEESRIIVKQGNRNGINEAFRVLRTNLEFMMNKDRSRNVTILTSFNPGSGKTFLCVNLAASLAIKRKKVLVIDGDLRKGSSSRFVGSPRRGLSNFLSHQEGDLNSLICPVDGYDGLFVLPVGTLPPNPTELLFDLRFKETIEALRPLYDYIFIDCPPIGIVADPQIIEALADRTIFVVRANLLEKGMIPELEKIYREQKFKNLSVILNGASVGAGRYGYKYGYHYGYGNGYGDNYGSYGSSDTDR